MKRSHEVTEAVIEAIKDLVLPELNALKGAVSIIAVRIEVIEKRLDDFNDRFQAIDNHLLDQSRRIDQQGTRIDELRTELAGRIDELRTELTGRIDQQTSRIDGLAARLDQQTARIDGLADKVGTLAEEVAASRRDSNVMADVLRRLARLEEKVAA